MHGATNIKFIDAQQAKLAYQYKNTKRKLLMMGGIVTRNMSSKAIAKNKRNCCILLDLFHYNPSDRTMALGSTQPLTEMSTRRISWG